MDTECYGRDYYLLTQLLRSSVINGSANLIPPDIGIRQEAFVDRRGGRQCQENGAERAQLVVHAPPLRDILGLERYLEATATHAKRHGILVNEVVGSGAVPHVVVLGPFMQVVVYGGILPRPGGLLIPEDRNVHLNLPAAAGPDVSREGGKPDMGVCDLIRDKLGSEFRSGYRIVRVGEYARDA